MSCIRSKSCWCLSGTRVQNRLDDLFSLFKFLKSQPTCDDTFWQRFIAKPLKSARLDQVQLVAVVMMLTSLLSDDGAGLQVGARLLIYTNWYLFFCIFVCLYLQKVVLCFVCVFFLFFCLFISGFFVFCFVFLLYYYYYYLDCHLIVTGFLY